MGAKAALYAFWLDLYTIGLNGCKVRLKMPDIQSYIL